MRARSFGLAAVVLALAAVTAAPALAGPANVTVRVEGDADTLVARTALTTTTATVNKDGMTRPRLHGHERRWCALSRATAGSWSGSGSTASATPSTRSKVRATRRAITRVLGPVPQRPAQRRRSVRRRAAGRRPGALGAYRGHRLVIQRAPRRGRAGHCDTGRRLLGHRSPARRRTSTATSRTSPIAGATVGGGGGLGHHCRDGSAGADPDGARPSRGARQPRRRYPLCQRAGLRHRRCGRRVWHLDRERRRLGLRDHRRRWRVRHQGPARSAREDRLDPRRTALRQGQGAADAERHRGSGSVGARRGAPAPDQERRWALRDVRRTQRALRDAEALRRHARAGGSTPAIARRGPTCCPRGWAAAATCWTCRRAIAPATSTPSCSARARAWCSTCREAGAGACDDGNPRAVRLRPRRGGQSRPRRADGHAATSVRGGPSSRRADGRRRRRP